MFSILTNVIRLNQKQLFCFDRKLHYNLQSIRIRYELCFKHECQNQTVLESEYQQMKLNLEYYIHTLQIFFNFIHVPNFDFQNSKNITGPRILKDIKLSQVSMIYMLNKQTSDSLIFYSKSIINQKLYLFVITNKIIVFIIKQQS
ncbi:unnamed protein product [Paramecium octaurelia]|uniref:Uncharacterized protein n=1 Tax=Paramecium octaurelia TaxID=43137 RepID=A0A8S1U3X1_PAROT|nr:unnamed protein product [Paramecium octaurelia]